ncbi:TM2 domain-containing protein [Bacillus sp. 165]|uniref:TM2 domain-containing protein n=1 Tax=Bacillus sp. 165 TaxID=1529117 RepID=UPI001AD9A5C5|nr:TM2 domain-containing protein [Bacillus sp. 165]MBO9129524.1 TM2 domain-containing protein [Bacillus sp. 165]
MKAIEAKQSLTSEQLAIVNGEMAKKQKSKLIAYLIWFFFGGIGGHRYYTKNYGMAIAMTLTLGGLGIWAFIDVFFVGKRVEALNEEIEFDIIRQVKSFAS